jgi:hypothetical protein
MSQRVNCSSCGQPAEWLVTLHHDFHQPGRILAYCRTCRLEPPPILVSIPLSLIDDDAFVSLYEQRYTESEPDFATEIVFGEERPDLAEKQQQSSRRT